MLTEVALAAFFLGFGAGAVCVYRLVLRIGKMRCEIKRLRRQVPPRGDNGRFAKVVK